MAGTVIGIILLVLGVGCMIRGWPGFLGTLQARRWEAVQGRIAASGYTYAVDGVEYTGTQRTFGARLRDGRAKPGAGVAVWYDPGDHGRSVLHPVDYASMVLFDVGVALVVIGVLSFSA